MKQGRESWGSLVHRRENSSDAFQYIQGLMRKTEKDFLPMSVVTKQGLRVLNWKRVDLDCIKGRNYFMLKVVMHWNRLPREAVVTVALDEAFMSSERRPCPWQGGWTRESLKSFPTHTILRSYDSNSSWKMLIQSCFWRIYALMMHKKILLEE